MTSRYIYPLREQGVSSHDAINSRLHLRSSLHQLS